MKEQVTGSSRVLQSLKEMKTSGAELIRGSGDMTENNKRFCLLLNPCPESLQK